MNVIRHWVNTNRSLLNVCDECNNTPLHYAALHGHLNIIRMLINFGCDASIKGWRGWTPLHFACQCGHSNVVKMLLSEGICHPMSVDDKGNLPIHIAATFGHWDIIQILVTDFDCDINTVTTGQHGWTALHFACQGGHVSTVKKLICELNCPMEPNKHGNTPIHIAALYGKLDIVRFLVEECGCNVNSRNGQGRMPLHAASAGGYSETVSILILQFGCSPMSEDGCGYTPLHYAAGNGHQDVIRLLVNQFGCNVNARAGNGFTPLHTACAKGQVATVRLLINEFGCNPLETTSTGDTPLHIAAQNGHVETVSMLVSEHGCNPIDKNDNGNTPLHIACMKGHCDIIKLLVTECGCSPSVRGHNGMTCMHSACQGGHVEAVSMLISVFGYDPIYKDDHGNLPVYTAAKNGHSNVVKLLLKEFSCDINSVGRYKRTLLHGACLSGNVDTVRMLISEFGCDPMAKDIYSTMPLHLSVVKSHDNVLKLLVQEYDCNVNAKGKRGRSALHFACKKGCSKTVHMLISEFGCDPMGKDNYGNTSLHIATKNGQMDIITLLISKYGCSINARERNGMTPLHMACCCNQMASAKLLLSKFHCNAEAKDNFGNTPLHVACRNKVVSVVHMLISEFNVNTSAINDSSLSPLDIAASVGSNEVIKELAGLMDIRSHPSVLQYALKNEHWDTVCMLIEEFSFDPSGNWDSHTSTPLHLACKQKDLDMVHKLIKKYCVKTMTLDKNLGTPLDIAVETGDMRIVKEFIGHTDMDNYEQYCYLSQACMCGHWDVLRVLISDFGCDPNTVTDDGDSILRDACEKKDWDMVCRLITEFGCDPNADWEDLSTPLHLACKNKDLDMVHKLILDFDVDTMAWDENTNTPLEIAIDTGDMRIIREFVGHVGLLNNNDQCSLLQRAYRDGQWDIFRVLVSEFNCDPSAVDDDGESVFLTACEKKDFEMVRLLITEFGCNPNVNYDGKWCSTPLHLACQNKHVDMVHTLISDFGVNTLVWDENGDSPLEIAIETGDMRIIKEFIGHILRLLISDFGCDPINTETDDNDSILRDACKKNDWDMVCLLITEFDCDPNTETDDNDTILRDACKKNDWDMVRLLITEFGCDPKVDIELYEEISTPLHLACWNEDLDMVHTLISDFNVCTWSHDEKFETPLEIAIETGDMRVVEEFIGHTDMNNNDQYSHLRCACTSGHWDILRVLISDFGCDPNTVTDDGDSILRDACVKKDWDVVRLLITEFGCKVDTGVKVKDGSEPSITLLELASRDGSMNIVKEFADYINTEENPLACCYACEEGHLDIVRVLISELGFDPMGRSGLHPLNYACRRETNLNIVRTLISEYGVSINAKDKDGDTAMDVAIASGCINIVKELANNTSISRSQLQEGLCRASSNGHLEMVECLIVDFDADPSSKNSDNDMPIHIAARHGHTKIVNMLINKFNISPVATGHNMRTPLHEACASRSYDVFKLLVKIKNLDIQCKDANSDTPLHIAAKNGEILMVNKLTQLCGALAHSLNENLQTPLHLALMNGHKLIADILLSEANFQMVDVAGNSPLHLAAMCGYTDMVSKLIQQYKCAPDCLNNKHQIPLHVALEKKHEKTADVLLSKFHYCPTSVDIDGNTPLHLAAASDLPVMVRKLIDQYSSIPDCRNNKQETPLLLAAEAKNWTIVDSLVSEFDCCPMKANVDGTTPLHYATIFGPTDIIQKMINKCASTPDCSNSKQETVLLLAAKAKNWTIVDILLSKFDCYPMKADVDGNTPLHYATMFGPTKIIQKMINKCASTPDCSNSKQETVLLLAAKAKNWTIVDILLSKFDCYPMKADVDGNTPLHYATMFGPTKIIQKMINKCASTPDCSNSKQETVLLLAAKAKKWTIIETLLSKFDCYPMKADIDGNTPLHYTAMYGPTEINRKMIKHCKSSLDCVNGRQETPLLLAAKEKNWAIVDIFLSEGYSPTAVDAEGNTVLHVAVKNGNLDLVSSLLSDYKVYSQPRNTSGHTPLYYASTNRRSRIVAELVKHNCNPATVDEDYKVLEQISHRKLSEGSLTKVFVIGNKCAGKSTLIEALKNETQQDPYFNDKVTSHTAGIVPSVHQSEQYGRVLFYDFAGDCEYYSSHAAALERLLTSSHHIFLLVVDFSEQEETILQALGYWLTFISYNSKDSQPKSQVIVVGSHADIIEAKGEDAEWKVCELFTEISSELCSHHPYTEMVGYCSLDCRTCECARIEKLYKLLKQCCLSPVLDKSKQLSVGAIILLGVLQRDFKGVIVCEVSQICMHIQLAELYLPQGLVSVYSYLKELNSQGVVLIVGNHEGLREEWVILDVSEFLATVHRKLFSPTSLSQVCSDRLLSNIGIIPESDLRNILAQFDITLLQQCLKYLQYCFEVDDSNLLQSILAESQTDGSDGSSDLSDGGPDISDGGSGGGSDMNDSESDGGSDMTDDGSDMSDGGSDTSDNASALLTDSSETKNYTPKLLFFPALLKGQKSEVHWHVESPACCKGWYIECDREYDYFPPRFLHVLLLRLAFTFTLPAYNTKRNNLELYSRRCIMWKSGIYWLMQADVECMVEVVKQNKALVVIVRSKKEFESDCACMFSNIVIKVLEARQDFCHSLVANAYLIHPDDLNQTLLPSVDNLHLFDMSDVKRALAKNRNTVQGVGERNFKNLSLSCLQTHSISSKYKQIRKANVTTFSDECTTSCILFGHYNLCCMQLLYIIPVV